MSILTDEQLMELNRSMVGLGEPVERDNSGYNKPHFYRMLGLSYSSSLTPLQRYAIADTLAFYKDTQLIGYKEDILDTLKELKQSISTDAYDRDKSLFIGVNGEQVEAYKQNLREEKRRQWIEERRRINDSVAKPITVHEKTSSHAVISWDGYMPELTSYVRSQAKDVCRWEKDGAKWLLRASWDAMQTIMGMMKSHNYFNAELDNILLDIDVFREELREEELRFMEEHPIPVFTKRMEDNPDTLLVYFGEMMENEIPKDFLYQIKHTFPKVDATTHLVHMPMILIPDFCRLMKEYDGMKFDFGEEDNRQNMAYWDKKTSSWFVDDVTLLDVSKLDLSFTPYDFQPQDAEHLLSEKTYLNANEMGCGKTFEQVVVGESIPEPKLVICPETLRLNWVKEIHMVNKDADVKLLRGKEIAKELKDTGTIAFSKDWNIIGYATLGKIHDQLEAQDFNVVMVDEAHLCKAVNNRGEPTSSRAKEVLSLCATAKYVYPITGTPKPNMTKDLFNLLRMIKHPITQGNFAFFNFGKTYCNGVNNGWGWDFTGHSNDEMLHDVLDDVMVRHLKKDVLPNLTKQRTFLPVECNLKQYDKIMDAIIRERDLDTALGYTMTARRILSDEKIKCSIDVADSLLEENKKVVIVCSFSDSLHKAKEYYDKHNIPCVVIEGGMSDEQKQSAIDSFQEGDAMVCAMNVKAGGVGITLTASYNMIINDYEWLPADMQQAEDRICRGGQTESCNIMYLYAVGAEIDEQFTALLTDKMHAINQVVDDGLGDSINMREEVLKSIFEKRNKYLASVAEKDDKPSRKASKATASKQKKESNAEKKIDR